MLTYPRLTCHSCFFLPRTNAKTCLQMFPFVAGYRPRPFFCFDCLVTCPTGRCSLASHRHRALIALWRRSVIVRCLMKPGNRLSIFVLAAKALAHVDLDYNLQADSQTGLKCLQEEWRSLRDHLGSCCLTEADMPFVDLSHHRSLGVEPASLLQWSLAKFCSSYSTMDPIGSHPSSPIPIADLEDFADLIDLAGGCLRAVSRPTTALSTELRIFLAHRPLAFDDPRLLSPLSGMHH